MLCPKCGTICVEHAYSCTACGFHFSTREQYKMPQGRENQSVKCSSAELSNKNDQYAVGEEADEEEYVYVKPDARWIGPRRAVHIASIIMGCLAARYGYILATLMGLFSENMSEAGGYCCFLGLTQIILGIIGLVKIRSRLSCGVIATIHVLIVLPAANYRDAVTVPGSDVFIAICVSLVAFAFSFSALYKNEGVVSGWICLAIYVAIVIFMNVQGEKDSNLSNVSDNNFYIETCGEIQNVVVKSNNERAEELWQIKCVQPAERL